MDNTTVVARGYKIKISCALFWIVLFWCNLRNIVLQAHHIPGWLNVIADKLSQQNQVIQTELSLQQGIFDQIRKSLHTPQINQVQPQTSSVSPVLEKEALTVDALSLS